MAEQILMLALSPTMEEGTIATWKKKEGDKVSEGDIICEVETDKATVDYESIQEGVLLKILVPEGEDAAVGVPIAIIGEEGEDISALEKEASETAKEAEKEEEAAGASASEEKSEAKKDKQEKPETAADKAEKERADKPAAKKEAATTDGWVKASPLAREIARQRGIDIAAIEGSGPGGRIVKKDVESAPTRAGRPAASGFAPARAAGEDRTVKVSKMRKAIAGRLAESKFTAPHFYLNVSVRGEALMEARNRINKSLQEKISVNAFIMKLAAEALRRHPRVNAAWEGDTIREFGSVDIGLAVALDDGLITPVVRNCGNKGIVEIDGELKELIPRAQEGKLAPEEYSGAGFSVSNLGSFGIEEFTAIINPPGSAILAVGALNKVPVVQEDGSLGTGLVMKFTLSCDHRVVDGAEGARFMATLKNNFENPMSALL
ncbi:pyruvate dehydrogenase complex dihydrolipoamide acetyltransferase [Marispirochaeta aestuarii]|uniref:pyruvate dehydrogenase complex dihydrolipoamide acetyltransferase n=1 Tax=Marispirochaeta aestuarii TaxID=1963862 RepID=UPI0029C8B2A1|nr:pyruvate dehydrogenase complex dihydrolipoamide acetyltransferase [Marispirochaeta aestuarii]